MHLLSDVRHTLRQLRRAPAFTLTTVLILGLGIGATTAVFSLVDTVLLRPLPFPEPERIVALDTLTRPRGEVSRAGEAAARATIPIDTSYPNFADWRERARSFAALASWQGNSFTLGSTSSPARRIDGLVISADFFNVLGVHPSLGRDFLRAEEQAGHRSVILSHALWQSALAGVANPVGHTIQLSDETFTVVGVMPSAFRFPNAPDAAVFITPTLTMEGANPSGKQRGGSSVAVMGRLAPGVNLAQATAEMQLIQQSLARQYPDISNATGVAVTPELQYLTGDLRQPLHTLFAAVALLLLITCVNVAGLLLTRTAGRRSALTLRSALGASRSAIARQLLLESLLLASLGGLLGIALAAIALRLAPQFLPDDLPRLNELSLDARMVIFSLAASLLTGLLFGVLPAWRYSRQDPAAALREGARSQQQLQSVLIVTEIALSLVLLIGAGLLLRSFNRLLTTYPGFNPGHLLTFRVGMPPKRFRHQELAQLCEALQTRLAALPGVQQSTFGFPLPLAGGNMEITFNIDGHPAAPGNQPVARLSAIPPNFFAALGIPLLRGRVFAAADGRLGGPTTVIVNQAFAHRFFPGEDAIGRHITPDMEASDKPESREIIGVVGNVMHDSLTEAATSEYFLPFGQVAPGPPGFAIRVKGDASSYNQTIRSLIAEIDPTLPVYAMRANLLTRSTAQQRFQSLLLSGFAALSLVLAASGLYAVLAYTVQQRTFELGLRLALGSQRRQVLGLVLRRGLVLAIAGLVIGLVFAVALTRTLASLLFHTAPLDPLVFTLTTVLLLAVALVAAFIPSWRASRLDPNHILRQQ